MIHINLSRAVEESSLEIADVSHDCSILFNNCMKSVFEIFGNVERGHQVDQSLIDLRRGLDSLQEKTEALKKSVQGDVDYVWAKLAFPSPEIIDEIRLFQRYSGNTMTESAMNGNFSLAAIIEFLIMSIGRLNSIIDKCIDGSEERVDLFQEMAWKVAEVQKIATAVSIVSRFPTHHA